MSKGTQFKLSSGQSYSSQSSSSACLDNWTLRRWSALMNVVLYPDAERPGKNK